MLKPYNEPRDNRLGLPADNVVKRENLYKPTNLEPANSGQVRVETAVRGRAISGIVMVLAMKCRAFSKYVTCQPARMQKQILTFPSLLTFLDHGCHVGSGTNFPTTPIAQ